MNRKIIPLLLPILLYAKIYTFQTGKTYDFAEEDFLTAIHKYIEQNKERIKEKLSKIRKEQIKKVKSFKPEGIDPLTPAKKHRVRYVDLTYTLPYDIKDQNGKVIYPKGFTFNPAKYVRLPYTIIVINAKRKREVDWLINSGYTNSIAYRILITDGNWYELSKRLNQPIYYCLKQIEERFKLEHTPSIVTQIGDKIRVEEIMLNEK